tara:strand:+ start:14 stop:448 length:435 start_codon:yes stop_codon:yes gene_type:complete
MAKNIKILFTKICKEHNKSVTPMRYLILKTLSKLRKPITAYELRDILRAKNFDINIATIYRIMDFFLEIGLIHKITFLNKYLICSNPEDKKHIHMINFCTNCEKIFESCDHDMGLDFQKNSKSLGVFFSKDLPIEVPIICTNCK